jgi:4-amino-4-deoxy-L-arabinose transferase-like glycosyltransferase
MEAASNQPTEMRDAHVVAAPGQNRNWPRALLLILSAGAALRLAAWLWFAPLPPHIDDEMAHVALATNIVHLGEYTFGPGRERTSLRPPLYPALVAATFAVFGDDSFQAVRMVQIVLSLLTCVVLYRMGRNLLSERAGLWCAGMFCFYPTAIGYCNLMLTETLFTLLLVAGIHVLSIGLTTSKLRPLAFAGLLLGLGALTRSILFPFAPVLAGFLLFAWRGGPARRLVAVGVFLATFAAVVAPWAIRNTMLQRTLTFVDCMGGRNFMMGNYEYTPLYRSWDAIAIVGDREWIHLVTERHPEYRGATQGQLDKAAFKEATRFVLENPGLTAMRDSIKFFDFWGLERELIAGMSRGYFGEVPTVVTFALGGAICGIYVAILFAGIFGAVRRSQLDVRVHVLIVLVIGFVCAVHTVVFAHSRYHVPIMPFMMLFAASVVVDRRRADWSRLRFALATALCMLVVAGWGWNALAGDASKLRQIVGGA